MSVERDITRWVRRLVSDRYGKVILVQKPQESNQLARLQSELRQVKEALADTHIALALEKAYLAEACEHLQVSVEGFKKKQAGGQRPGRSKRSRR